MGLLYIDKVPEKYRAAFQKRVAEIAFVLEIKPEWLMMVMNSESGLDHTIVNHYCKSKGGSADTCATGLIQFMPKTAAGLGVSGSQLQNMNPVQQLEYVFKYFYPYRNKIESFYDLYLVTFYPVAMGKPNNWVIGSEKSMDFARKVAQQNSVIDTNGDGLITIKDFKGYIDKKIQAAGISKSDTEANIFTKAKKVVLRNWLKIGIVGLGLGTAAYFIFRKN